MTTYQNILVAIDCSEESRTVLSKAFSLADAQQARLQILHVIEPLALAYGADIPMDISELQQSLLDQARESVIRYAKEFNVPEAHCFVELGSIEKTIRDKAEQIAADLIVVGSHTRTGLALLLGSTAKGLVPGACCDVLAVKVGKEN